MINDPISDMITRIRNASAVRKSDVVMPMSKMKFQIAKILERTEWISGVEVLSPQTEGKDSHPFSQLKLKLRYNDQGKSVITSVKRISKPGRRVYANKQELPVVLNNFGIAIVSTSQGVMTNKEAKRRGVGGEVLCEIY